MWLPLAMLILCLTIVVLFRMYIDLKRQEQAHQRMMRSDQRDYERYMDVKSRELPKAALPDFDSVRRYQEKLSELQYRQTMLPPAQYYESTATPSVLTGAQLEALKATYAREDYDRFMYRQRMIDERRRTP